MPDTVDDAIEQADRQTLIDLLGPALDRCSELADRLAMMLLEPR